MVASRSEGLIQFKTSSRGFQVGTFRDHIGAECSIQESSLATEPAIWLGQGPNRMHLTQELAGALWPLLKLFAEVGSILQEP